MRSEWHWLGARDDNGDLPPGDSHPFTTPGVGHLGGDIPGWRGGVLLAFALTPSRQREPGPLDRCSVDLRGLAPTAVAVLLGEIAEGSLDAKAVALLGILAACGAALRVPSPGVAGFEPVFFLLIPAGRVLGRGFGFVLGAMT